jgi:hypothetical protein
MPDDVFKFPEYHDRVSSQKIIFGIINHQSYLLRYQRYKVFISRTRNEIHPLHIQFSDGRIIRCLDADTEFKAPKTDFTKWKIILQNDFGKRKLYSLTTVQKRNKANYSPLLEERPTKSQNEHTTIMVILSLF